MATKISKMAVVDSKAELGEDVEIGPFCSIGPDVKIGDGTRLISHVSMLGRVAVGRDNTFHPFTVIGGEPQDISYTGSPTEVRIGDNNIFRESVTVNRATEKEDGITAVGSHCFFMACAHIAHDCKVGSHIIMANGTMLGGHVHVFDHATISGAVAVHHFISIGSYSFVGGLSRVLHDVPPFMLVEGIPTRPRCVNVVALKRNGFSNDVIRALSEAHRLIYRSKVGLDNAREILKTNNRMIPEVNQLLDFIQYQQEGANGRGRDRRKRKAA